MLGRVNLVVGQAQTGKTTLAIALLKKVPRLLVLDPVRSKPITAEILAGRMRAFGTWTEAASFLASGEASGEWHIALRAENEADYQHALHCAPYYRHVVLLVDEGLWFCSNRALLRPLVKVARANAHFGGGLGVPLVITAQRPMDLPPDIRSQADQLISFRQDEPNDLGYLAERCTPAYAEIVAGLGVHRWEAYPPLNHKGVKGNVVENDFGGDRRGGNSVGRVPAFSGAEPEHAGQASDDQGVGLDDGE